MKQLILMLLLACSSFAAHGQQPPNSGSPCPPGMIPGYGTCYSPSDSDRYSNQPQSPVRSGALWQDRFGAIASDSKTGSIGWASNARSKKEAHKAAVEDCGGGGCQVKADGRNTCLAEAWGGGVSGYGTGINLQRAEEDALSNCKSGGGSACKIDYSACSLPVRVR
ncbi:MAG: DUF4189 domain-containing protein [Proteobacteria bacterium]|nr:DUF4189 domain-containing protein [Pseudomonadota bacterium]MBS0218220.1 DUF4189 domain-containing protein [Pseudomonadota bacterium]